MVAGETGTLFPAGDQGRFREAIRELALNRERLARMGLKARSFTLEQGPCEADSYSTILRSGPLYARQ